MNYVNTYLRLEDRASGAESKARQYRQRADENRWEQCRIAFDAVESGEFSRSSFARAVGVNESTIRRQYGAHHLYGSVRAPRQPAYADAIAEAMGTTQSAELGRKQISNARAVLKDPNLARELMADPIVRAVAAGAINDAQRAEPAPRAPAPPTDNESFLRCANNITRVSQSLNRLVVNLNAARRSGYMKPAIMREFTKDLRLYADAIDEIAGSRGLTDEALYEWIGES